MTQVLTATPNQWFKEYNNKGIPSSFRDDPSGSVKYFLAFLQAHNTVTGRLLDIGCGTARNSQYMADQGFHVTCVDYVKELIERIKLYKTTGENIIRPVLHDISTPWPFVSREFDVAIDTFCYKHQILLESKDTYKKELARVLKKNGYYLLTLAGTDDGYYKQFLNSSPENNRNIIIDAAGPLRALRRQRLAGAIFTRRVLPHQLVFDHINDPRDHPQIIHPRHLRH